MNKKRAFVLDFLKDLKENNHKDWMDANRDRYQTAKEYWLEQVNEILLMLMKYDKEHMSQFKPKDCISRINNNRRFHPDKPPYKDYFTFSVMDKVDMFSPIHLSFGASGSFVGCGYHNPEKDTLHNIREAIDYEGKKLHDILNKKDFRDFYGGLSNFADKLKTSPREYAKNHEYVDLLRYKAFVVSRDLSEKEMLRDDFIDIVERSYVLAKPFRDFLKRANSI